MSWHRYITYISARKHTKTDKNNPWDFQSSALGAIADAAFVKNASRKKVEDESWISRDSLAVMQRIGQIGSWRSNIASGLFALSDEACRIFEMDQDKCGVSYEDVMHAIHPDDREKVNDAYLKSLESHASFCIDLRLLFHDGRIKHVRVSCETNYAESGKPLHSHGTVQDISALKFTEQQLENIQDKLREFVISRELLRENERKRIAWKMHEELGQLLAGIKMRMQTMRIQQREENSAPGDENQILIELIDQAINTVREIVSEVRPAVLLYGPAAALEWLVTTYNKQFDIRCELDIREDEGSFVSDELTTLVFRIAQESLENAMRHKGVNSVILSWVSNRDGHCLTVMDDGENSAAELYGDGSLIFFGMQELVSAYGGKMQVSHSEENGTLIEVRFL